MIADFGLSRVMEEERFQMLTEICGTPGVCAVHNIVLSRQRLTCEFSTWLPKSSKKVSNIVSSNTPYFEPVTFIAGHGKPVDIWAMGVITYFLLTGESFCYLHIDTRRTLID